MEPKKNVKLQYIHSHVKKARLTKPSRNSGKKKQAENLKLVAMKMPILKYFSPLTVLRIIGDFAYLDQTSHFDEYVKWSSLNMHFKQIKEITTSVNFTICSLEDYGEPPINIEYLYDRLLSLNDQQSYDLACKLKLTASLQEKIDISGSNQITNDGCFDESTFFKILDENAHEPIFIYHFKLDPKLGNIFHKIGSNKILKNLIQMNDLEMFQQGGPLLIPVKDYFNYMKNHLDMCFGERNQVFPFYLQSPHGVLKVYGYLYQIKLLKEIVIINVLPKRLQEPHIQQIYEGSISKTNNLLDKIEPNKGQIKNLDEWENLIKKYYAPWIFKENNIRCGFIEAVDNDFQLNNNN